MGVYKEVRVVLSKSDHAKKISKDPLSQDYFIIKICFYAHFRALSPCLLDII